MSANFSSDSIVWVDGQVTLPKHILKILGIENGHRSNVTFIVENGEVKIVNSAAYAMNNLKKAPEFYRRITDNFKRALEHQGFSNFVIFSLLW